MRYIDYYNECLDSDGYVSIGHLEYKVVNRVLYFQCSRGAEDWQSNFDIPVVLYKDMLIKFYVHRGFASMWKQARDIIAKLDFDIIIGYSQGAIFACLAYEDTLYHKHVKRPCITFGSPRFLWMPVKAIRDRFRDILRLKNPGDLVAIQPPTALGYRHIGDGFDLCDIAIKPKQEGWLSWSSGHSPSRYRQNLEAEI